MYGTTIGASSTRISSIVLHAAFWASTPIADWYSAKAASNSGDVYCDEFQMPSVWQRRVEVDVGRGAVAVVDDAELGGAGARRVGRLGRAPLGAVERVEALAGELEREAARRRLAWISCASCGISCRLPKWSTAEIPSGKPASASSCLAISGSSVRCGTESSKNG